MHVFRMWMHFGKYVYETVYQIYLAKFNLEKVSGLSAETGGADIGRICCGASWGSTAVDCGALGVSVFGMSSFDGDKFDCRIDRLSGFDCAITFFSE